MIERAILWFMMQAEALEHGAVQRADPGVVDHVQVEGGDVAKSHQQFRVRTKLLGIERFEQSHRAIATTRAQDRVDVFTIKRMLERLEALAISACEVTSRGGSRERLLEYDGLQAPGAQLLETLLEVVFEHGACGGEDRDARSML